MGVTELPKGGTAPTAPPRWQSSAILIGAFTVLLYVIETVDVLLGNRLDQEGVRPRTADGLWGILFAPLLHAGWGHLVANTIPVLVLGFLVLMTGIARGLGVTATVWLIAGIGVWLTGPAHSSEIGASVLIFGWLTFLLARGLFTRSVGQILLGLVVLVLYGGLLWGVLPNDPRVSWQGHLFGAIGGVIAAWLLSSRERSARRGGSVAPQAKM